MVKLRDAKYCNIKVFLIFLVVYGHLIEEGIWQSEFLMAQYKLIYFFHMPLFCFMSGLFVNSKKSCSKQIIRLFPIFIICQILAVIFGDGNVEWNVPYWHLWYLLSYCFWLCLAWVWFKICRGKLKIVILFCAVIIGCVAGLNSEIGREYSLSRSLVFFPYFWAGFMCKPFNSERKLRNMGIITLIFAVILMFLLEGQISAVFLYQATPYGATSNGMLLRFLCYTVGGLLIFSVLVLMPARRLTFTRFGTNTMIVYLLHVPLVLCLKGKSIPWPVCLMIVVVFIYVADFVFQWYSGLYGIISTERRGTGDTVSKSLRRICTTGISLSVDPDRK